MKPYTDNYQNWVQCAPSLILSKPEINVYTKLAKFSDEFLNLLAEMTGSWRLEFHSSQLVGIPTDCFNESFACRLK